MNETKIFENTLLFLRRPAQFALDLLVLSGAFVVAYLLRFEFRIPRNYVEDIFDQIPFVVFAEFSALFLVGAYSILWRYVSIEDIKAFIKAALISTTVLLVARFFLPENFTRWRVPLSIILMATVFGFGGLLAVRILRRFIHEIYGKQGFSLRRKMIKRKATLFVGAGKTGATAVREALSRGDSEIEVRGFIDDDRQKKGGSVSGIKVLGTTQDLARLVDELHIDQVAIAIDKANGMEIRRVVNLCQEIPVKTRIVPSLHELVHGKIQVRRIRDVQIEDLLGRDEVELDDMEIQAFLTGKIVMVTGAGGSIGSELVRQIAEFEPKQILLVERSEFFLFEINRELDKDWAEVSKIPLIADISDEKRMREIFEKYSPEVVFHAAAHKHVPLMEANPCEAIKNNVFATKLLGELAGEFKTESFVLISTDKAVNPTSVMGASKRIAEIVLQDLNSTFATRYIAVRFGNVLGSAGSVVPIFKEQIRHGGPVFVTDKEMTRYFMTIPEAAQLVMQAGTIGKGGEIFILDMGEPVRIIDLAEDLIRLSGLTPYEDIGIEFSGMRPGEKLFEELEITGENLLKTRHPKIFIGKISTYESSKVQEIVGRFSEAVEQNNEAKIRQSFNEFLPEASIETEKTRGFSA